MSRPQLGEVLHPVSEVLEGEVGLSFPQPHGDEFLLQVSHRVVGRGLAVPLLLLLQVLDATLEVARRGFGFCGLQSHLNKMEDCDY